MSAVGLPALWAGVRPILESLFLILASTHPPKRGRGQIISAILAAVADGETSKTHLMYKSNLDSRELKRYMSLMTESELLLLKKDDGNHDTYHLTEKGMNFLQRYNELEKLLTPP